jgi:hypothetical protein
VTDLRCTQYQKNFFARFRWSSEGVQNLSDIICLWSTALVPTGCGGTVLTWLAQDKKQPNPILDFFGKTNGDGLMITCNGKVGMLALF